MSNFAWRFRLAWLRFAFDSFKTKFLNWNITKYTCVDTERSNWTVSYAVAYLTDRMNDSKFIHVLSLTVETTQWLKAICVLNYIYFIVATTVFFLCSFFFIFLFLSFILSHSLSLSLPLSLSIFFVIKFFLLSSSLWNCMFDYCMLAAHS